MFAQLGSHIFRGLQAPRNFDENNAAKYGQIPLINRKDVLQKTGDELQELTLTVQYSVEFCNPASAIGGLKGSMADGEILPLIMGDGSFMGKYVITALDVRNEKFTPEGTLEAARVTVSLLEYANGEETPPPGQALKSAKLAPQPPLTPMPSPAASITNDISQAKSNVTRLNQLAAEAKGSISDFNRKTHEVRKLSNSAARLYSNAKTKLTATRKIAQRAKELPGSLDEAIQYAENLAKLDNVTDFTVIAKNMDDLNRSAERVSVNAAPVVAFGITREAGN